MRSLFIALISFSVGCGSLDPYNTSDVGDLDAHAFEARYRVTTFHVAPDADTDGDGVVDNHLVDALAILDTLATGDEYDVDSFNALLDETIAGSTRVLLDARVEHEVLQLDVVAETDGVLHVDDRATLTGELLDPDGGFVAGPGELTIPVQLYPDAPIASIALAEALVTGELVAEQASGRMRVILPVESIVEDLVAPVVEDGSDIDGDGQPEPRDEVMDLAWSFVPLVADVALEDGRPGVSAVVDFTADAEAW